MTEATHAQIIERIAKLEVTVEGVKEDVKEIRGELKPVIEAATMGKGVLFAILKFGTFLAAAAGGIAWLIDRVWR